MAALRRMITTAQLIPNAASKVARKNSGNCGECAVVVLANGSIRHEPVLIDNNRVQSRPDLQDRQRKVCEGGRSLRIVLVAAGRNRVTVRWVAPVVVETRNRGWLTLHRTASIAACELIESRQVSACEAPRKRSVTPFLTRTFRFSWGLLAG